MTMMMRTRKTNRQLCRPLLAASRANQNEVTRGREIKPRKMPSQRSRNSESKLKHPCTNHVYSVQATINTKSFFRPMTAGKLTVAVHCTLQRRIFPKTMGRKQFATSLISIKLDWILSATTARARKAPSFNARKRSVHALTMRHAQPKLEYLLILV